MRHFLLVLLISSALSDMTVDVKRGQKNVTLPVKTPEMGDVNRVTFCKLNKNGTQVPIFRYCSDIEKKRGCTAIDTDRFSHQLGSENVSVIIRDASATDAGTYNVEVIGNNVIEETFTVVFTESSDGRSVTVNPPFIIIVSPHITVSPPYIITIVVISLVIILAVIAIIVVTVVSVCICKKKNRKKLVFLNSTVDSEVGDSHWSR
ncbi:uncharacterized protein LOC113041625 isoform X2 [Carassius auratus]|uniref:Uncharacterized protein LOC113041625 isoform X2 n=1 Tax=Carassius auratus TaxID=7957 RepID=A0A6P6JE15_CARAU|nr:uncharacterized protein LOC113041625 isoform X2 [Carassius auratus]